MPPGNTPCIPVPTPTLVRFPLEAPVAGEPFTPTIFVRGDPCASGLPLTPTACACTTRGEREGPASGCGRADMGRLDADPAGEAAAAGMPDMACARGEADAGKALGLGTCGDGRAAGEAMLMKEAAGPSDI
jgi:hypothetical protein